MGAAQWLVSTILALVPAGIPIERRHCPIAVTVDSHGLTDFVQRCIVYVTMQ